MSNDQGIGIKDIKVIAVEKPQKGKLREHFEYVIRVTYDNDYEHLIFRRYSMLFHFHSVLKEVVKETCNDLIVLPELPVARFQHVGRKFLRLGLNKELKPMTEFCQKIISLPRFISEKDIILKFFDQLGTDVAHAEAYQEANSPKDQNDKITAPSASDNFATCEDSPENQFRSLADFEAVGTGELSVVCDEVVTVIEKNTSGWWLVSNASGETGFTPATYLEPVEDKVDNNGEWVDVPGPDNVYTAIKDYEAQCPDELSFKTGEELEVIAMSNFGWWRVRRNQEVGLSPASSLALRTPRKSSTFYYTVDAMNEFRTSISKYSKKSSTREAPPRTSSTKSDENHSFKDDHFYGNVRYPFPERYSPQGNSLVKYTKVIPKGFRPKESNNNDHKQSISYVNVPVIRNGTPHYVEGQESEAINVHMMRKDFEEDGVCLREGDEVQVISVLPDGRFWKVATIKPPFKEGIIPCDLLCPEFPSQLGEPSSSSDHNDATECSFDCVEPVKVMPRFTAPPSIKKPIPAPRSGVPKSPLTARKGDSIVARSSYAPALAGLLAFHKGDAGRVIKKPQTGWWFIELKGFEGWVPAACWEDVKDGNIGKSTSDFSLPDGQWFRGKMSRDQCENLFEKCGKHLDFIIRESIHRVGSYVLSMKFQEKVHHFNIEKSPTGKLQIGVLSFDKLSEVVMHYTINPLFFTDHKQPVSIGKPLSRI